MGGNRYYQTAYYVGCRDMLHKGMWIGGENTFDDWGTILTDKDVPPPEPRTNYIELEGMNGALDLSEALSGEITYRNRVITASFWTNRGTMADRSDLIAHITAKFHGRKVAIGEPEDLDHYFWGRVSVQSVRNTHLYSEFTIKAVCDPWRYARTERTPSIEVSGTEPIAWTLHNWGRKTICPEITVEGEVTFTCNGVTSEATTGLYKITTFKLFSGKNNILVSGNGTLALRYREADL